MFEKEAFALLTKRVWAMLDGNETISVHVTDALVNREPQPFQESVARVALQRMTQEVGRMLVPAYDVTGDGFIDAVSFGFAYFAAENRPEKYADFTEHTLAEMLITKFCQDYVALAETPTSPTLRNSLTMAHPLRGTELRARIRAIDPTQFGRYTIRK
jgi:hypothetical protein